MLMRSPLPPYAETVVNNLLANIFSPLIIQSSVTPAAAGQLKVVNKKVLVLSNFKFLHESSYYINLEFINIYVTQKRTWIYITKIGNLI